MDKEQEIDCAIIGGGIAGLCLAIQLARQDLNVVVFEKHRYPFHKVCGEYVSNESRNFFINLGLELDKWNLPTIDQIGISSLRGFMMQSELTSGGFGISRFRLDEELANIARAAGVTVIEECRVHSVKDGRLHTGKGDFNARLVAGTFGKSSPAFAAKRKTTLKNFIGVKYHVRTDFPHNRIELHNFKGGYCGISKIENDRFCLCYLSDSENLRQSSNSISQMEEQFVKKNPFLKTIFENSEFLFEKPVTVSNIGFEIRQTHDKEMLFLGDAAGCISPLTGNGMSMAARTSVFASNLIGRYLRNEIKKTDMQDHYHREWMRNFDARIKAGKKLQYLFGKDLLSHLALKMLDPLKPVKNYLIDQTHGETF
jgi:flavin-dependent dehydrogenase